MNYVVAHFLYIKLGQNSDFNCNCFFSTQILINTKTMTLPFNVRSPGLIGPEASLGRSRSNGGGGSVVIGGPATPVVILPPASVAAEMTGVCNISVVGTTIGVVLTEVADADGSAGLVGV